MKCSVRKQNDNVVKKVGHGKPAEACYRENQDSDEKNRLKNYKEDWR